jgi:hypothetical protein
MNLKWTGATPEQAFDPDYAIKWAAARMKKAFNEFKLQTPSTMIAWNGAILNHHAPTWARSYVSSGGVWPNDRSMLYVTRVKNLASSYL